MKGQTAVKLIIAGGTIAGSAFPATLGVAAATCAAALGLASMRRSFPAPAYTPLTPS